MKKTLNFIAIFMLAVASLRAQNGTDAISRFFSQYAEDERFTVVYISPKMFQMVSKIETNDADWEKVKEVVKDLGGLRVLVADSIADGDKLYADAMRKIPTTEYSELLTVRDGKENVRIWIKDSGNVIHELLLLVGAPDEFVLLSFTGKIDLDKISSLAKTLDIEGAEHLEKVKGSKKE